MAFDWLPETSMQSHQSGVNDQYQVCLTYRIVGYFQQTLNNYMYMYYTFLKMYSSYKIKIVINCTCIML